LLLGIDKNFQYLHRLNETLLLGQLLDDDDARWSHNQRTYDPYIDYSEYESKIYNKVHVEFEGHDIYLEYGIWYIDGDAIVEPSGYVYKDKENSDGFNFIKEYCEETSEEQPGGNYYPVTVTVNCLAGDTLDLAKVSINVYDKNGVLVGEVPQNSLSGTISTGESRAIDIKEIFSGEAGNYNAIKSYEKVEVFVLFGDHVLVSKDIKVRG
jgi:hypothetical protein